jgi:folylpolyglutamate synthase
MQYVIFSTYDIRQDGQTRIGNSSYTRGCLSTNFTLDRNLKQRFSPSAHELYSKLWKEYDPLAEIACELTIEGAIIRAEAIGNLNNGIQVLVIGSLHLVSGVLCLFDSDKNLSS